MTVICLSNQRVVFSETLANNVSGRSAKTYYSFEFPVVTDELEKRQLDVVKRMANTYNTSQKKDELEVFVVVRGSNQGEIHLREKSSLLKDLSILIGCENIHIKLTLSGLSYLNKYDRFNEEKKVDGDLCSKEMAIWEDSATICFDEKIVFPSRDRVTVFNGDFRDIRCNVKVEAILNCSNVRSRQPSLNTERMTTYRKMLNDEIHSDTSITAKNGYTIKAHKAVLSAASAVFEAMFQTDMIEASTHQIEMPDMSEEGLKAFLAFVYYLSEDEADKTCGIAYELLNAGHKYNVLPDLEKAMTTLLLNKPADWYNVDTAVKTFSLARNLESGEYLKIKCIQVLKTKSMALSDSEAYKDLFKKDPSAAMELCQLSFSATS